MYNQVTNLVNKYGLEKIRKEFPDKQCPKQLARTTLSVWLII
ncbi:hypothetical protein P700755_002986 [Psychroflexus torquis ATCC 700755]|uniref:Uncharacterized protein n=1 Tax=Psychroflexus torquis (strain ATCC 700755 / CIP 106069 / ACAM 623) TaxID=313595 RepID=K4IIN2_PSYTT|nr:hypothetical protein P700755_002986 [Psychroflexus torquis ATCC 700755]